jgi:hypothetical protein
VSTRIVRHCAETGMVRAFRTLGGHWAVPVGRREAMAQPSRRCKSLT